MAANIWIFSVVISFAAAKFVTKLDERSACPDVSTMCDDTDTSWCHETAQTYFYLEDGTKCLGCSECIPEPPKIQCPVVLCPMWDFPMNCRIPRLFSLYINYGGRECRACEIFYCLE